MRQHHPTVVRVILALIAVVIAEPVAAQICRIEISMENQRRRVRGDVNVECGGECNPTWPICHTAPWGNWGVDSPYGPKTNKDQFRGWKGDTTAVKGEWNSCTGEYNDPDEHFNDGPGRQKAYPDDDRYVASDVFTPWGRCDEAVPEVYTKDSVYMSIYELDWDMSDYVTGLGYGTISFGVHCSTWAYCYGASNWKSEIAQNYTRTSAQVRLVYKAVYTEIGLVAPQE